MAKKNSSKDKTKQRIVVPLDVPASKKTEYLKNINAATHGSGKLMLFAGDQKFEHLNDDFSGKECHPDDYDPEHMFRIASKAKIGAFATQLGMLARYGMDYPKVPYIVKLNSKSHLVKTSQKDPLSTSLVDISQVMEFKRNSKLNIVGVGYTIFLGSESESIMFREASQAIYESHKNGLFTVIWIYPRGKAVTNEKDAHLIAGATGVALCLGTDFVKVNYPSAEGKESKEIFKEAIQSAGRTKVICAGGGSMDVRAFLQQLKDQINVGASGNATGRNIHQKSLPEAIRFCNAIYAITVENKTVDQAMDEYNKK